MKSIKSKTKINLDDLNSDDFDRQVKFMDSLRKAVREINDKLKEAEE
jgi:hypothetical protein